MIPVVSHAKLTSQNLNDAGARPNLAAKAIRFWTMPQKIGPLNDESRWGLYVHPLLAMTPQRVPLGVVTAKIWSRDPVEFAKSQEEKRRARKAKPLEEKESVRWLEGYQSACALAAEAPDTTIVAVSDSEGDIFECLQAGVDGAADYIVRGCQDRALVNEEHTRLRQTLACKASLGTMKIRVSKREASTGDKTKKRKQPRAGRIARVSLRAAKVLMRGPARPGLVMQKAAPSKPPLLSEMVKRIAELGGYLNRKHDGPPGPQTMWIGLQRTRDFAIAWSAFGSLDQRKDV